MCQIPPTGGVSLAKELLDLHSNNRKRRDNQHSERRAMNGLLIFELCCSKIYILDEQQRSQDQLHSSRLDRMRMMQTARPFTATVASGINELIVTDAESDIKWSFDSVLMTPTNAAVNAHNYIQMHQLAIKKKTVLIKWRVKITTALNQLGPEEENQLFERNEHQLYSLFVAGAPIILLQNINIK